MTKFTATMTNGETATRTSKGRTYTHCVQVTAPAIEAVIAATERHLASWRAELAEYEAVRTPEDVLRETKGKAHLADWTVATFEGFAESVRARIAEDEARLAKFEARRAAGERFASDSLTVVRWSSSYDLAVKGAAEFTKAGQQATILEVTAH